jgi:hypothetical protein
MAVTRAASIQSNLAHALAQLRKLNEDIRAAQTADGQVAFLGQHVGNILAACRECFDYCAQDLVAAHLPGAHFDRVYFPFTLKALSAKPWRALSQANANTYDELERLAHKIESSGALPGTIFRYRTAGELNSIVNKKKHDQVIQTAERERGETHVTLKGGASFTVSPMFSFDGVAPAFGADVDAQNVVAPSDAVLTYPKVFRLSFNGWDVRRFCDHSIQVAFRVIAPIYANNFGVDAEELDPVEALKPSHVRRTDKWIAGAQPVVSKPVRLGLRLGDAIVMDCEVSFEGDIEKCVGGPIAIAELGLAIYDLAMRREMDERVHNLLRQHVEADAGYAKTPRYCELRRDLVSPVFVTLNGATEVQFDSIIWGIGTRFNWSSVAPSRCLPGLDLSTAASLLDGRLRGIELTQGTAGVIFSGAVTHGA